MSEPQTTTSRSSSVLYGLGKLAAETANHALEIARLREAQEALPGRVIAGLAPQLVAMNGRLDSHDTRIVTLERRQWLVWGGGATLLAIIGYALQLKP